MSFSNRLTAGAALGGAAGGALIGSVGNALIEKARGGDWKEGAVKGAKGGALIGGATGLARGAAYNSLATVPDKEYDMTMDHMKKKLKMTKDHLAEFEKKGGLGMRAAKYLGRGKLGGAALGSGIGYGVERVRGKSHEDALAGAAKGGLVGMAAGSLSKSKYLYDIGDKELKDLRKENRKDMAQHRDRLNREFPL